MCGFSKQTRINYYPFQRSEMIDNNLNHALIIAYFFPPAGGGGVQRTLKFTKYLPDYNWLPEVLTVNHALIKLSDTSLLNDIPKNVPVHRSPALLIPDWVPWRVRQLFSQWFLIVDEQLGWLPFALHHGERLIINSNIKVIYSTSSPYTDHLIGYELKKRTNLPWVADFRDPWVDNNFLKYPTRWHKQIVQYLEKAVINKANRIIVVSEQMRSALLKRYTYLNPIKVEFIPNGYDPSDFNFPIDYQINKRKFIIVYTGSIYGKHRDPRFFFEALKFSIEKGFIPQEDIAVYFIGNTGQTLSKIVQSLNLNNIVHQTGYLSHKQSIEYLLLADLLLLIISSNPGNEIVYTGKLFEYLEARKPILALSPPGAASDLINKTRSGVVVPPENVNAIINHLVYFYKLWKDNNLSIHSDTDLIAKYNRKLLTAKLAQIFNEIVLNNNPQ
jgi:glycosyltransferase involved in cell wall biosynthesis